MIDVHRDALTWAAGRSGPPPTAAELDGSAFVRDLGAHRLDARFLERVRRSGLPDNAFGPGVLAAVRRRQELTLAGLRQRMWTAERLGAELRRRHPEDRLIMFKGFTLYGLTADETVIRHSGDLDVITRDAGGFVELAQDLGYEPVGPRGILAGYADLEHPRFANVDVHSYYPMTAFPRQVDRGLVQPAGFGGLWSHGVGFEVAKLHYRQLVPHTVRSVLPGLSECWLLRPEVAALIHASHLHIEHLRVCPTPSAAIRLDELATFRDLCRLPQFTPRLMGRLIEQFGAHDVVEFARALAIDLLGEDPLAAHQSVLGASTEVSRFFPRDLWWDGLDGFPVDLGWEPAEFVTRTVGMIARLESLAADDLTMPSDGTPAEFAATSAGFTNLSRLVFRQQPGVDLRLDAGVRAEGAELIVRVALNEAGPGEMTGLSLNFGDRHYEFFFKYEIDELSYADYSNVATGRRPVRYLASREGGYDIFDVGIPWERLGAVASGPEPVPLLLSARRQTREWGAVLGEVIIPLILRRAVRGPDEPGTC